MRKQRRCADQEETLVKVRAVVEIAYDVDFDDETFSTEPPEGAVDARDVPEPPSRPSEVLEVGAPAPDWTADLLDRGQVALSDHRGRPLVVLLWATWCPEVCAGPGSADVFAQQSARTDAAFISVASASPDEEVRQTVDDRGYQFPVALDPDGRIQETWMVNAVPGWVFLHPDGTVAGVQFGPLPDLDRVVDALVAGTPLPLPSGEVTRGPRPRDGAQRRLGS